MRDGEPNMYAALAMLRNGQTQLQWSRIQMLLIFNMVAMPITTGGSQSEPTKLMLSMVGVLAHLILLVASFRGSGWIDYWDDRIMDLERLDSEELNQNGVRVQVFSHPEFKSFKTKGRYLNKVFVGVGILFTLFWFEEYLRLLGLISLLT